ncbi:MAG: hypothetical protein ABIX12_03565, partial [Rubrivivax sp.]
WQAHGLVRAQHASSTHRPHNPDRPTLGPLASLFAIDPGERPMNPLTPRSTVPLAARHARGRLAVRAIAATVVSASTSSSTAWS